MENLLKFLGKQSVPSDEQIQAIAMIDNNERDRAIACCKIFNLGLLIGKQQLIIKEEG
jgi:hypothetical protein